jgi:7-cyano-7-deazaguanine synthase
MEATTADHNATLGPEGEFLDGKVVVLHSGGQDSSTCLAWAIRMWGKEDVLPVIFDYGQRHRIELEAASRVCSAYGVSNQYLIKFEAFEQLGAAALTASDIDVSADATGTGNVYAEKHGLPSTFVPGRNMLFFTLAAAYGAPLGATDLVTGVCEADDAGYPDCRAVFVESAEEALRNALDESSLNIYAPLLKRSKAETFKWAQELGVLDVIIEESHTCYMGDHHHWHDWGYGCGVCPACKEREKGWKEFKGVEG